MSQGTGISYKCFALFYRHNHARGSIQFHHWAASRVVGIGEEYPVSFYTQLVQWFSKDGDTVTEVGTRHRIGMRILSLSLGVMHC